MIHVRVTHQFVMPAKFKIRETAPSRYHNITALVRNTEMLFSFYNYGFTFFSFYTCTFALFCYL